MPEGMVAAAANSVHAMPSPEWTAALESFDQDLARRAVADKTRRAYAIDSGQFAGWATSRDLGPAEVGVRDLRRYLAALSESGRAPSTIARKLAVLRGMLRVQTETGLRTENPAELLSSPKRPQRLPRVLKPAEVAELLDRIPATTPLELRDRALFELAYSSGLRAEELVSLDRVSIDFDAEHVRVEGKGSKTPAGSRRGARAPRARAVPRARPPDPGCCKPTRSVLVQIGPEVVDVRRAPAAADLEPAGDIPRSRGGRRTSARFASLLRDSSA